MTYFYMGTLRTPEEVREYIEKTPHHTARAEYRKGEREGIDPPSAMLLSGYGKIVRIPSEVWKECPIRPGGEFDTRMYRWDDGTPAEQTSQEPAADGRRYRHLKRGSTYTVLGDGEAQVSGEPIVDGDIVRIYVAEDGKFNVRKSSEFLDGRFEEIE